MISDFLSQHFSEPDELVNLRTGEFLFSQGDEAKSIYRVQSGRMRLERYLVDGRSAVMYVARGGDTLAEASLFFSVYHCHAIAEADASVEAYRSDRLLKKLANQPELYADYCRSLAGQVRQLRGHMELRNIKSARERVLQFLVLEVDPEHRVLEFTRPMKSVAAELGLAHETFYRVLATLETEGLIERQNDQVRLV